MENNPLYQGQTATVSSGINYSPLSTAMPGAEEALRNGMQASKTFQMLTDALIERNDDTILRRQENAEKQAAMNLTAELQRGIEAQPGDEGSLYDEYGRVNKGAVNALRNKYLEPARYFQKGIVNPLNLKKSQDASSQYQLGVDKMIQTSLLAATKTKQEKVYRESMALCDQMGDYNGRRRVIRQGIESGAISKTEGARQMAITDESELLDEIEEAGNNPEDFYFNKWMDEDYQATLARNPKALKAARALVRRASVTGSTAGTKYKLNAKTGKVEGIDVPAIPPRIAPVYLQELWLKYNGDFDSPEAQSEVGQNIAMYLSRYIDEPQGTKDGDQQYVDAWALAEAYGMDKSIFDKIYKTRLKDISRGALDASKYINRIAKDYWLTLTEEDEQLAEELAAQKITQADYNSKINFLVEKYKNAALDKYTGWNNSVSNENPDSARQANQLLSIIEKTFPNQKGIVEEMRKQIETRNKEEEMRITKEKLLTKTKRAADKAAAAIFSPSIKTPNFDDMRLSVDTSFELDLLPAVFGAGIKDSKEKNIIYVPLDSELEDKKKLMLAMPDANYAYNVEIRKVDIDAPVMSSALYLATKTALKNPAKIKVEKGIITFSNDEATDSIGLIPQSAKNVWARANGKPVAETDDAKPVAETDDGLVGEDDPAAPTDADIEGTAYGEEDSDAEVEGTLPFPDDSEQPSDSDKGEPEDDDIPIEALGELSEEDQDFLGKAFDREYKKLSKGKKLDPQTDAEVVKQAAAAARKRLYNKKNKTPEAKVLDL